MQLTAENNNMANILEEKKEIHGKKSAIIASL